MKVKIDSSSSTPRIDGDYGTLEYSEQSNKLFIKSRRRGVIQIGSDSTVSVETDPAFTAWLSTPPNLSTFTNDLNYLSTIAVDGITITGDGTISNPLVASSGGLTQMQVQNLNLFF